MGRSVPDRWLEYKSHGRVIKNTRIIAFKVPLKYETCRNLLPSDQFTPEILMRSFPNLKYIIDLTATNRYYNRNNFISSGVEYIKVIVPGQQIPRRKHCLQFFDAMDTFMAAAKDDELIGVHCTHGLNRTGFMVCQYLIRQLGWNVSESIKEFEEARGHTIERQPYLNVLKLIQSGEKLIVKMERNLIIDKSNCKSNERCKSVRNHREPWNRRELREQASNWRDHAPLPSSNYNPPHSFRPEYRQFRHQYPNNKNSPCVNNPSELITNSLSTPTTPQSLTKKYSTHRTRKRSNASQMEMKNNVTTNVAEKIRKLEDLFPTGHSNVSSHDDFTNDSYENNLNTAYTIPIPQTTKRKG